MPQLVIEVVLNLLRCLSFKYSFTNRGEIGVCRVTGDKRHSIITTIASHGLRVESARVYQKVQSFLRSSESV